MRSRQTNRQAIRRPLTMSARCRLMSGLQDNVTVSDLSTHGCRIATRTLSLAVGTRVMLKLDGLEAISCTVRWVESGQCGLQFERPIYEPVVEHLCRLHVQMSGEVQDWRARTRGVCSG
ncbi:hypothetical protein FHW96_002948 [Novosphingobium sp. SG751A]|uniref:PilZ domain-containing protein n=1 Tax=Novosphingobium sp. SG751A TaxID=2587000 RepID=UPI0015527A94|nr:PilZ domain-containing protein [Novosphingobium sp. SG751A]NOW46784.1 hypothetical protein [Novosphingobium sp. SG751A]